MDASIETYEHALFTLDFRYAANWRPWLPMRRFGRGSEWRKWDLHVHAPGTRLNDGYGEQAWDQFCDVIEQSDVSVIGITDYFALDTFFETLRRHRGRHADSEKVFFPNLELRLNESVNVRTELVHLHLVFRPDISEAKAAEFLSKLITQQTDENRRRLPCSELSTKAQLEAATVSREDIKQALRAAFGTDEHVREHVVWIVPANNDGIRARGTQRHAALADEIERDCDALFGNPSNVSYFVDSDRYEADIAAAPKPVFAGSDAHNLADLAAWLGKTVTGRTQKHITWVKADPTFEGLQHTMIEPGDRVRINPTKPDTKQPYKVVSKVSFTDNAIMPSTIELNSNLVSIIGSRSSGKSALLAYIAHAINSEYTVDQQRQAQPHVSEEELGPAAGIAWGSEDAAKCEVEWADGAHSGQIIYIPQNSLFALSSRPAEITEHIAPALYRSDFEFEIDHGQASARVEGANSTIRDAGERWFALGAAVRQAEKALADLGDANAIESRRDALETKIEQLRAESSLTEDETAAYQDVVDRLTANDNRQREIESESGSLARYLVRHESPDEEVTYTASPAFRVDIRLHPETAELPPAVESQTNALVDEARASLETKIVTVLVKYREELDAESKTLRAQRWKIDAENSELIAKNQAQQEIEAVVNDVKAQRDTLARIVKAKETLDQLEAQRAELVTSIETELANRRAAITGLKNAFEAKDRRLEQMTFGIESKLTDIVLASVSEQLNRNETGPYVADRAADIDKAQREPAAFLPALETGEQKVRQISTPEKAAIDILTATPEIRFYAELEGDRVGGFEPSSMTPGKQAFFALSLILSQDQDHWPLLIDQPEDDLDSRSVYDVLVDYLKARKAERQIIMVSHNANLVVGADTEQVLVANRHGSDRRNTSERTFDYLAGSLEHSQPYIEHELVLMQCGVREHACAVLDGGEEAFLKRQQKYRLR